MSQVIDYDNRDIEKLSLYTRHLQPMLRERLDDDEVYFSNMIMSHYRFFKLRQQDLKL
jgi:type I restriction enzyme, R subunit